jgi:hypothetical protein
MQDGHVTGNYTFCGIEGGKLSEIVLGKSSTPYPFPLLQKYENATNCVSVSNNGIIHIILYTTQHNTQD